MAQRKAWVVGAGLIGLAVCGSVMGAGAAPPSRLVIAVQPTATPEQLSAQAAELEQFLEARLGQGVELKFPTSHAGVIEALRFGHAQAAFMSAWPAALAVEQAESEVALAEVREVLIDGKKVEAPSYYSYWIVLKESPYTTLAELRGKRMAFSGPLSTSGYVAPVARLVELGLLPLGQAQADPKAFFNEVLFAGGYAQAWAALKAGQVDVSVIAGDVPETLYHEVLSATRVLEQQGPIPSHAVVIRKDLPQPLRGQLLDALQQLGEPQHRPLMRKFISGTFIRFAPTTSEQHLASLQRFLTNTRIQFTEKTP